MENLIPIATAKQQEFAVKQLLKRNFGSYQSQIDVKIDPTIAGKNEQKAIVLTLIFHLILNPITQAIIDTKVKKSIFIRGDRQ